MSIEKTIILYSNNNYEFAYKIKKICKDKFYIVKNINSFSDLFLGNTYTYVPLLFVDMISLKENKEIRELLIKLTPTYFKKLVLFFDDKKYANNKNIFVIEDCVDIEKNICDILTLNNIDTIQIENLAIEEGWIKKVSNYLTDKGFYLKHLGSQMLIDAVLYCYQNPNSVSSLSATAYNFLAAKYSTTLKNFEISIRRAIESAVKNSGKIKETTNKEFIMVAVCDIFDSLKSSLE